MISFSKACNSNSSRLRGNNQSYVLHDPRSPAPTALLGKGPTSVAHRGNYISQISLLLGLSQNCMFLKSLCSSPFFSGRVWSKLFVWLHIRAESSIPAWGLWAGDCPSSAALRAEGKEAELLFVLASFSGVNHQ